MTTNKVLFNGLTLFLAMLVPLVLGGARGKPESILEREGLLSTLSLDSSRGPVVITAKAVEFDYETLDLTYRGGVTVKQGDLVLQAERLHLRLDEDASEPVRKVTAEGNVRIAQGEREAFGGRAVFDQDARTVTLSDGAVLRQGPNEITGERVVVYLDEQRSVVEGGGEPVRARLFPPEGKGNPAPDAGADGEDGSGDDGA